jgi:serine O-acetyltransferase
MVRLDDDIAELYHLSVSARRAGDEKQAFHFYRQLRAHHGVELFYEIDLVTPFRFVHPLGSVLGRARYAAFMVFYQNVGVGSDIDGNRPAFYGPAVLFPGARVVGKVRVGSNVFFTTNTTVSGTEKKPVEIPDNVVVFPQVQPDGTLGVGWKPTARDIKARFFNVKTPEVYEGAGDG